MDLSDNQIQILESVFIECPNPDEAQRAHHSRELRVEPQHIKIWFKNRRAQMRRARHEQVDNHLSGSENDEIDLKSDEIH
ncbi:hypothetical protein CFC21_086730 [Triticum aestivum]|uniref:Homeobox domain-containing protein n=3 Tax=Triticum TaxID=4564 RepID=A0A9R0YEW2_TRITD|nr:hypothetical protein CFC21_086730 [Triticum aestivum]VAI54162.1 unnamed protein product [Triticum turgidum subsp. durum]